MKKDYNNYGYMREKTNNRSKNSKNINKNLPLVKVATFVLLVLVIGIILVLYICQFVQIAQLNYQFGDLEDNLREIKDDTHLLQLKLAQETSMAKIEKIAKTRLNMVEPDKVEYLVLNKDTKKNDALPKHEEEKIFFVKMYNNLMESLGTVKAKDINK
ncbi:MAG: hypothetical protein ACOC2J_03525 [bacterium]